jgi:hypothetical protein
MEWIVDNDNNDALTNKANTRTGVKKRSKRGVKQTTTTTSKKGTEPVSTISPLLTQWASGQQQEDPDEEEDNEDMSTTTSTATSFTSFDQDKRTLSKKSLQQAQDEERNMFVMSIVQQIQDVLSASKEENKKTSDITTTILKPLQTLMELPNANTNLRQLLAGNKRYDYRLAWVGSERAICHIGTGLHNVPLARLQEIYLCLVGKSRLEVLEVIRILGPFPNVRNTLQGTAKIGKRNVELDAGGSSMSELAVTYDSMIDGTGKQIKAGMENNARKYELNILFCDENAIVAMVPNAEGADPLQDNGANILFFAREESLDENLEKMRVL